MCALDFWAVPPFDCADDDSGDVAFVRATKFIGGRYVIEEFLACGMYPLAAGIGFDRMTDGVTPVSRLKLPLLNLWPFTRMTKMMFNFWLGLSWTPKVLWVVTPAQSMTPVLLAYAMKVA
jgi:hypothetical protein